LSSIKLGYDVICVGIKVDDSSFSHSAIHGLALATINLSTKFEVSISTHYEDMKVTKYLRWMVWGSYGSLKVTGNRTN